MGHDKDKCHKGSSQRFTEKVEAGEICAYTERGISGTLSLNLRMRNAVQRQGWVLDNECQKLRSSELDY